MKSERELLHRMCVRLLIAFVGFACQVATADVNLENLSWDEREQFAQCRIDDFAGQGCKNVFDKACNTPENRQDLDCVEVQFNRCSRDSFASPECAAVVRMVCDETHDQFHLICDKYRYQQCLAERFEPAGCDRTRMLFTLPIIETRIDAKRRAARGTRPLIVRQATCDLANGDAEHPFSRACQTEADLGTVLLEDFESVWNSRPEEIAPLLFQTKVYEAALANSFRNNAWDSVSAISIWLDEQERASEDASRAPFLALAARVLAKFGDDGTITNFLLIEAAQHESAQVRAAAIEGLGQRRYQSGLVIMTLLRALRDDSSVVRAAALSGVAGRWIADYNSAYVGRLDRQRLGNLFDCRNVVANDNLSSEIRTLADVAHIDLLAPENVCAIGRGAQLVAIKRDVWSHFLSVAGNGANDSSEQVAALRGLGKLAAASTADRLQARTHAIAALAQATVPEVRLAALELLSLAAFDQTRADLRPFFTALIAELEAELAAGRRNDRRLDTLLALALQHRLVKRAQASTAGEPTATPTLKRACFAADDVPLKLQTKCLVAAQEAEDVEIEDAIYPRLIQAVQTGRNRERKMAIEVFTGGAFQFVASDGTFYHCGRRQQAAQTVASTALALMSENLSPHMNLWSTYLDAVRALTTDSPEVTSCTALADMHVRFRLELATPVIQDRAWELLRAIMPTLPMKDWYAAVAQTRRDVIEPLNLPDVPNHTGLRQHYTMREDLTEIVRTVLERRTLNQLLHEDHAFAALKRIVFEAQERSDGDTSEDFVKRELWKVQPVRFENQFGQ